MSKNSTLNVALPRASQGCGPESFAEMWMPAMTSVPLAQRDAARQIRLELNGSKWNSTS